MGVIKVNQSNKWIGKYTGRLSMIHEPVLFLKCHQPGNDYMEMLVNPQSFPNFVTCSTRP